MLFPTSPQLSRLFVFSGLMGGTLSRVTALLGSGRSNRQVIWNMIFTETILSYIVRTLISFSGHVLCGRRGDSSLHTYILLYITVLMKLFVIDFGDIWGQIFVFWSLLDLFYISRHLSSVADDQKLNFHWYRWGLRSNYFLVGDTGNLNRVTKGCGNTSKHSHRWRDILFWPLIWTWNTFLEVTLINDRY